MIKLCYKTSFLNMEANSTASSSVSVPLIHKDARHKAQFKAFGFLKALSHCLWLKN